MCCTGLKNPVLLCVCDFRPVTVSVRCEEIMITQWEFCMGAGSNPHEKSFYIYRHTHRQEWGQRATAGQRRLTPRNVFDIVFLSFFSTSCSHCFNLCFCVLSSLFVDARWVGSQTLPPQVTGSVCPSPPSPLLLA